MSNTEIAQVFQRIAMILDLKGGENPFRVRAYERAALMVGSLSKDVREIYEEGGVDALENLPGVGKDLALKIEEFLQTGRIRFLEKLEKEVPQGLLQIMEVEGMGPKKTKLLWQKFKVKDIASLTKLLDSGKLLKMKGWREKSVENIRRGIELRKNMIGRLPIGQALPLAEEILSPLRKSGLCGRVEIAGSLRRFRETCGDIDILATSTEPEKAIHLFCSLPQVLSIKAKGETKSTVFLKAGIDADLRVVDAEVFGAAWHYFTGSKDHNVHIRKIGVRKGITISEYGVYRGTAKRKGRLLAARTEEDVYKAVGLPYIEPELREDRGEIEAGLRGDLPILVREADLTGDLHMHSTFSDGADSIVAMAEAARARGFQYIAITDHASPMGMVKGLKEENTKEYMKHISEARKKVPDIHILAGAEVDILEDGRLYLPDGVLHELDWVVASVHSHFRQSRDVTTKRLLRTLQNPHVHALGHLTGRLLGEREGIDVDREAVLQEAKKRGVALELNASPERLDLNDIACKRAKELGVKIVISSDAHSKAGLHYHFGIAQARRGWLERGNVLNTGSWEQVERWLKGRR